MTQDIQPDRLPGSSDPPDPLAQMEAALHACRGREAALRDELEHRVRNMLAITRSVFSRTMDNAESVEEARSHFNGRLDALARYHGRLAAMPGSKFDLETMVWDELTVCAAGNDPRIKVSGPIVRLASKVAEMVGLALHELATNSVKFGVLGEPASIGGLRIEWTVQNGRVRFEWAETGVPIVAAAPIGSGFGRDFIEQGLPYQLGATSHFTLVPGGLRCQLEFAPDGSGGDGAKSPLSR